MSYRIPDKSVKVDPAGSLPTIKFKANLASTHFHIQTKTPNGWVMVVDDQGLGKEVQIKGGPINSAADFAGKRIFWDITLASLDDSNPVEATTYSWDFENRLSSVMPPGSSGTVTFRYDSFGRRIQKSSSSGTTNYLYDGANSVEEMDVTGALLAPYTQGGGIDEPMAELRGGTTGYYQQDGLGSVTSIAGSTGTLLNTDTYDSSGNLTASTGSFGNPFQYTGRDTDSETGLRYYRARYYDSTTGRFISEDPKRTTAEFNLYRYALNSPVNFLDPLGWASCQSGHCADCPGGRWASGAVTGELYGNIKVASAGGLLFAGVFICMSNPTFNVPFVTLCGFGTVALSPRPPLTDRPARPWGGGGGLGGAAFTCKGVRCREELAGPEAGWFAQVGPAYYFKEGGGNSSCQGAGVGFELGLGGGGFKCNTWIGDSIGGVK